MWFFIVLFSVCIRMSFDIVDRRCHISLTKYISTATWCDTRYKCPNCCYLRLDVRMYSWSTYIWCLTWEPCVVDFSLSFAHWNMIFYSFKVEPASTLIRKQWKFIVNKFIKQILKLQLRIIYGRSIYGFDEIRKETKNEEMVWMHSHNHFSKTKNGIQYQK